MSSRRSTRALLLSRAVQRSASAGLALVLLALAAVSVGTVSVGDRAGAQAAHAGEVSDAYQRTELALHAMEVARHELMLERSAEHRARFLQERRRFGRALDRAAQLDRERRELVWELRGKAAAYDGATATLRAPDQQVDRMLDSASHDLVEMLDGVAEEQRAQAAAAQRALRRTQQAAVRAVVLVLVPGLGLLVVCALVLGAHRRQAEESARRTEHQALHDGLTGLPNRRLLSDRFDQALLAAERDGRAVGLLLIDLDRFKEVNDTFGHHFGDALLTQVGPRLTAVLRAGDTVARLGGDEFAVLLPAVGDVADVVTVARSLESVLERPFVVEGVDLDVEASIGAVLSGVHGDDAATLLQRADVAMYVAKAQNLGVFAYDAEADGHSPERLALLGDLRRGLDRGELVLHYQPKVGARSGEVVGAEALVRWQHPERGLLLPDAFLPLAEHTGLIGPLTRYVLDRALAQARRWCDAGRPLPVSVNLSARNLLDEHLPAQVEALLARHDVPVGLLELEVTESALMTQPARARRLLEALSGLGVRLALDDFGAGYTSLGQLRTLPVTELKIDKSFVLGMTDEPSDALIVRSVIELGHDLGLRLVAEGVETQEALEVLADQGCDVVQGYHLSRPLPVEAFDRWRAEHDLPALLPGPRTPAPVPSVVGR